LIPNAANGSANRILPIIDTLFMIEIPAKFNFQNDVHLLSRL